MEDFESYMQSQLKGQITRATGVQEACRDSMTLVLRIESKQTDQDYASCRRSTEDGLAFRCELGIINITQTTLPRQCCASGTFHDMTILNAHSWEMSFGYDNPEFQSFYLYGFLHHHNVAKATKRDAGAYEKQAYQIYLGAVSVRHYAGRSWGLMPEMAASC